MDLSFLFMTERKQERNSFPSCLPSFCMSEKINIEKNKFYFLMKKPIKPRKSAGLFSYNNREKKLLLYF